jgi:beta-glucosidase
VLEAGDYKLYAGTNVRNAQKILEYRLDELVLVEKLEEALAPVRPFERLKPVMNKDGSVQKSYEAVPLATILPEDRRRQELPDEIPVRKVTNQQLGLEHSQSAKQAMTGTCFTLQDVMQGKAAVEDVVAQFSDEDLACIIRGEGMGSSLVTPGTASAFGGVSDRLRAYGLPAVCCDDGPSGMRLDSGMKAFSLPNGTLLGCSFHPEMVEELYGYLGLEMISNKVDNLLGPGMNIHRHPLNGRNFEYFSEDPYVTGIIGAAQVRGLQSAGVTGTIKHFACNNQE